MNRDVDDIFLQLSTHNSILNSNIITSKNPVILDLKAYENLNNKLDLLLAKQDLSETKPDLTENSSEKSRLDPTEDIAQVTISQNATY